MDQSNGSYRCETKYHSNQHRTAPFVEMIIITICVPEAAQWFRIDYWPMGNCAVHCIRTRIRRIDAMCILCSSKYEPDLVGMGNNCFRIWFQCTAIEERNACVLCACVVCLSFGNLRFSPSGKTESYAVSAKLLIFKAFLYCSRHIKATRTTSERVRRVCTYHQNSRQFIRGFDWNANIFTGPGNVGRTPTIVCIAFVWAVFRAHQLF